MNTLTGKEIAASLGKSACTAIKHERYVDAILLIKIAELASRARLSAASAMLPLEGKYVEDLIDVHVYTQLQEYCKLEL